MTHHVASHSGRHSQNWRGLTKLGVCAVVHQAMQVVGLGRGDYPTDVAALGLGPCTVAANVGGLLTHHLQGGKGYCLSACRTSLLSLQGTRHLSKHPPQVFGLGVCHSCRHQDLTDNLLDGRHARVRTAAFEKAWDLPSAEHSVHGAAACEWQVPPDKLPAGK